MALAPALARDASERWLYCRWSCSLVSRPWRWSRWRVNSPIWLGPAGTGVIGLAMAHVITDSSQGSRSGRDAARAQWLAYATVVVAARTPPRAPFSLSGRNRAALVAAGGGLALGEDRSVEAGRSRRSAAGRWWIQAGSAGLLLQGEGARTRGAGARTCRLHADFVGCRGPQGVVGSACRGRWPLPCGP